MSPRRVLVYWVNGGAPSEGRITHTYSNGKMVVTGSHFTICLYPDQQVGGDGWDESKRQYLHWEYKEGSS